MLLVEINTFLLIAKRVWPERRMIRHLFYLTWFAIRVVYYPVMFLLFLSEFLEYSSGRGSYINRGLVLLVAGVALNSLNAKWTFDLVKKLALPSTQKRGKDHPISVSLDRNGNVGKKVEGL
jgi:hypothetical protein